MFFCFYLIGKHYIFLYLRQIVDIIRIVLLRAIKTVVTS
jgi:hypothetical protein